jgi:hypothetical protein
VIDKYHTGTVLLFEEKKNERTQKLNTRGKKEENERISLQVPPDTANLEVSNSAHSGIRINSGQ